MQTLVGHESDKTKTCKLKSRGQKDSWVVIMHDNVKVKEEKCNMHDKAMTRPDVCQS